MDDFLYNDTRIYYLGVLLEIRFELIRDHIKDIDLCRISLKQLYDLFYINLNINIFLVTSKKNIKNRSRL